MSITGNYKAHFWTNRWFVRHRISWQFKPKYALIKTTKLKKKPLKKEFHLEYRTIQSFECSHDLWLFSSPVVLPNLWFNSFRSRAPLCSPTHPATMLNDKLIDMIQATFKIYSLELQKRKKKNNLYPASAQYRTYEQWHP